MKKLLLIVLIALSANNLFAQTTINIDQLRYESCMKENQFLHSMMDSKDSAFSVQSKSVLQIRDENIQLKSANEALKSNVSVLNNRNKNIKRQRTFFAVLVGILVASICIR